MPAIHRRGFTLVELLVVIAIIGTLVGLLLPAVQAARESARRTTCGNNLKQMGLAALNYESAQKHFPSGGWGFQWSADADAGLGPAQPGGWAYQLLPFIEQQEIFALGADGVVPNTSGTKGNTTAQKNGATQREKTVVPMYVCPSRRAGGAITAATAAYQNINAEPLSAGIDYAANGGNQTSAVTFGGALSGSGGHPALGPACDGGTGVVLPCSDITIAKVTDGLSCTLLFGEKHRNPDDYDTAVFSVYGGGSKVISLQGLAEDTPGVNTTGNFGSAHRNSAQFVLCDGSVRPIAYSVTTTFMSQLAARNDGKPTDKSGL
ncbi:MAG: Type secretion system protein precursor [Planctomycetota bacterium]|jgi:prepilin-type N-terminal cleavage/methylation domain-containing protein